MTGKSFGHVRLQGETVFQFINNLQKVPYRINRFIFDIASQLEEKGIKIEDGKFIPEDRLPMPIKPHDIDTNPDALAQYKKEWLQ